MTILLDFRFDQLTHERFESQSRRQAQRHRLAAATVMRTYSRFVASCRPSTTIRKRCTKVSSPKTAPVVITYAFMGSPPNRIVGQFALYSHSVSGKALGGFFCLSDASRD